MNEGRDVWSGGNLSEKGAQINKSLRRGLDIHKSMELFPKKAKPSEIDQTLEGLQEAQDYVEKERRLRRIGGPFADGPLVEKAGTSEGAKRGWETRRGGGAEEEGPKAAWASVGPDTMSSLGLRQHGGDPKGVQTFEGRIASGEFTDKRVALENKLIGEGFKRGRNPPMPEAPSHLEVSTTTYEHPDGRKVHISESRDNKAMDDAVAMWNSGKMPPGGSKERPFYGVPSHMEVVLVSPEARRDKDTGEDLPFAGSPLVGKEGTSEGAKRGWETRREGGAAPEGEEPKAGGPLKVDFEGTQTEARIKGEEIGDKLRAEGGWKREGVTGKETYPHKGEDAKHMVEYRTEVWRHPDGRKVHISEIFDHKKEWEHRRAHPGEPDISKLPGRLEVREIPAKVKKDLGGGEIRISKDEIEKILKGAGWDKLPIPDKAKEALEDLVSNGARPVSEYTGKLMIEHGVAEEPPAFVRPKKLKVGDTVIPLDWRGVCLQGAKFDMPNVPAAAKVKKIYMGPAKVTKNAYPFGRMPGDLSKVETVTEERMWGLDLEGVDVGKDDDFPSTYPTRDTTMVMRMEALASPSGEVNPGEAAPR